MEGWFRSPMPVTLHLFGAPTIDLGNGTPPITLPFERRSQLLVLLALKRSWVGRAELASMLWPDQTAKLAFTNLRKTLFRLQGVTWGAALESQGQSLRVQAGSDVQTFEQALAQGRVADALSLVRGLLLAGFDDDGSEAWTAWLHFERTRLQAAWRTAALEHLGREATDEHEGIALSARLLEADPLDEAALRHRPPGRCAPPHRQAWSRLPAARSGRRRRSGRPDLPAHGAPGASCRCRLGRSASAVAGRRARTARRCAGARRRGR